MFRENTKFYLQWNHKNGWTKGSQGYRAGVTMMQTSDKGQPHGGSEAALHLPCTAGPGTQEKPACAYVSPLILH